MMSDTIMGQIQKENDPKAIGSLLKLCIDSSVRIKILYALRDDWDEIIPDFEFECLDCEGNGRVMVDSQVGRIDQHGPWVDDVQKEDDCERCWGKGFVTWEDVPDVY